MPKRRLASVEELKRAQTLKFAYRQEGIAREGFIAWTHGKVVAYENVCRHIPITLDYGDGRFFNREQTHFICQTHGATYEPLTGLCVAGPCLGASLKPLRIEVFQDEVWFDEPD